MYNMDKKYILIEMKNLIEDLIEKNERSNNTK